MAVLSGLVTVILVLSFLFFLGLIWWKIFKRTGYHPALGLLVLIPIANLIMLVILAFKEWPIQRELIQAKGGTAKSGQSLSGPSLAVIIIIAIIPVMGLLAAIAIPNFLRARLMANESVAEATVKTICNAIESYAVDKGRYPLSENDLKSSPAPHLSRFYNNETLQGYSYSLNFIEHGYRIVATPTACGSTGIKIFRAETGGYLYPEKCK